jgi:light-regulated signal transduction histidine kinase (bacteriophytochrome)
MARILDGEELTELDVHEIETVNGERRTVMIHGMPVRNEHGEVRRGVITQTDITERREYQRKLEETVEKLEISNERLEQFAYAASHDLQEPLRMVSSYLRLIKERYADAFDEEGEEFLAFAVDGADRMRAMIDGLLAYSRVETGGDPLGPVELDTVLDDVLATLRFRI